MRSFVNFVIQNHHFSVLLILIILIYGTVSLYQSPLNQDPEINIPKVNLSLYLDGASPSEMQRNVVFPIEAELRSISDMVDIRSIISHNFADIWLTFKYGVDPIEKSREVNALINNIKRRLPSKLDFRSREFVLSDYISSFVLVVDSEVESSTAQYHAALDLVSVLERLDGLKNIAVVRTDEEVSVELDINAMRRLGISIDQVNSAMRADNAFAAGGRLHVNDRYFRISGSESFYQQVADMYNTVLYSATGQAVQLREFAKIQKQAVQQSGISRLDGKPVFFIRINTGSGINILEVKERVASAVDAFREQLNPNIKVSWFYDQSIGVRTLVFDLANNFMQGAGILLLVLLFSVGFRSGLIITSILPLSFLTAIFLLGFTGYGIQQMSIAGFIIALGLIVDNGIVVTENTYILQRYQGYTAANAALQGASSTFSPLLSSTLTTVLAFVPIFMLTSDIGLYLRSMSVTIWLSLLASLFIAVTVVTLLLSRVGTLGGLWKIPNPPSVLILLIPFRDKVYKTLVTYAVKLRWLVILLFSFALLGSLWIGSKLPVEVFPLSGEPYLTVNLYLPAKIDESHQRDLITRTEQIISGLEEVEHVASFANLEVPRINAVMDFRGEIIFLVKTHSGTEAVLKPFEVRLKQALQGLKTEANFSVSLFQYKDLSYSSPFTLQLSSNNVQQLKDYAKQVHDQLRAVPGVESLNNPMKSSQPLLRLAFNSERAAALGIAKSDVDPLVNMLSYGWEIDRFRDVRGKEFPLLLKIPPNIQAPLETLQDIMVTSRKGGQVPLSEVLEVQWTESESYISHLQFNPTIEIDFWVKDGYVVEEVADAVLATLQEAQIPTSIQAKIGGVLEKKQQNFQGLGQNTLFVTSLVFAIFVLQFRSFSQPLIIFSAVPLCIIGALLGLYITEQNMTFVAAIGITSLLGIVVNDSILLVEEGNELLHSRPEMSVREVAIEAARARFMPVLLTSLTTIAGLLPMAMGDSMFKTMAIAISGGLFSSTFLILFLVPVLFSFLSPPARTPISVIEEQV